MPSVVNPWLAAGQALPIFQPQAGPSVAEPMTNMFLFFIVIPNG
jgi:hypothetical protein